MNSRCLTPLADDIYHPVSQARSTISPLSVSGRPGSLIQIDCRSEGSLTGNGLVYRRDKGKSRQRPETIDVLPDDILLEIFDYYLDDARFFLGIDAWHILVHVSRKWRCVVFDSPRRLNLQLLCLARRPVREMLTIWPPLPIIIRERGHSACNEDNITAALEHRNRVCEIRLTGFSSSVLEKLLAEMQVPFPALTWLELETKDDTAPVIAETFLGGFAPDLETLSLKRFPTPFPGLRKLFLSTTNLVNLILSKIPHSGYISPEAMATCLSALTRLEALEFRFESPRSRPHPGNPRAPPPMRTLLSALRQVWFTGVSDYLEDLVARIDAPHLDHLDLVFFHQLIFDTPHLAQFIGRESRGQKDQSPNKALVTFSDSRVYLSLPDPFADGLDLGISSGKSDWQLSALAQVCSSSFPRGFISMVEHLHIVEDEYWQPRWQDDVEDGQWLELLQPFTGVKDLFLSKEFVPRIAPALRELVGERANEVLPALQSIHLEGLRPSGVVPEVEVIGQFVNARHVSGHPIAVIPWTR